MASVKPSLHIFPAVEEVQKRKESLDELIRRSMDMRPTGPFPSAHDQHLARPRGRVGGRRSPSPTPYGIQTVDFADAHPAPETMRQLQKAPLYPLQTSLPAQRRNMSQSPSRRRPRRCPSASRTRRGPSPAPLVTYPRIPNAVPSMASSINQSPISPADSTGSTQDNRSTTSTEITAPDRSAASSRASNRKHTVMPTATDVNVEYTGPVEYPIINRTAAGSPACSIKRYVSSRASQRTQDMSAPSRVVSPTPSERTMVSVSDYPMMQQVMLPPAPPPPNSAPKSHFSPISPEETTLPMRSMFPMYNPTKSLSRQSFRPAPITVTREQVRQPEYSPSLLRQVLETPRQPIHINDAADLEQLWNCTNGQIITLEPKKFTMKVHRPVDGTKKQNINFGPSDTQPFFSLSQQHPSTDDTDGLHEVLIFRHSMTNEDILPICHSMLQTPPPPSMSKITRAHVTSPCATEPAVQITSITPILATLHSLDNAAKTPQAHTLALVDPRATSPAAARLAERAVADAIAREACTLSWTKLDAQRGKYELHHPSLGVFNINVEGDIAGGLAKAGSRFATSITITNPFAASGAPPSPMPMASNGLPTTPMIMPGPDASILARLDLVTDTLDLNAAAIQQLGNIYLIDVCVSAILSVAVAESQRQADPGLVFAAPPPSPFANPHTTKKQRAKMEKAIAATSDAWSISASSSNNNTVPSESTTSLVKSTKKSSSKLRKTIFSPGSDMSLAAIEHLLHADDLPRVTRGILAVLGFSFKTAVWLLSLGVRLTAGFVVGVSRLAVRD